MPTYNLGTRTLSVPAGAFQARIDYDSDNNRIVIRHTDGTQFNPQLIMPVDTAFAYDEATLVAQAIADVAGITVTIDEPTSRVILSTASTERGRFRPPASATQASPRPPGAPDPGPDDPVAAPVVAFTSFPLPRATLSGIRSGGDLFGMADGNIVYISDAPIWSPGLYVRRQGTWATVSGLVISGSDI